MLDNFMHYFFICTLILALPIIYIRRSRCSARAGSSNSTSTPTVCDQRMREILLHRICMKMSEGITLEAFDKRSPARLLS